MTAVEITFCRDVSLFTLGINNDNVVVMLNTWRQRLSLNP